MCAWLDQYFAFTGLEKYFDRSLALTRRAKGMSPLRGFQILE
jgi:hypothetical protein